MNVDDLQHEYAVCVVGLGYVGLPIAAAFSKKLKTYGVDSNPIRIAELSAGCDITGELSPEDYKDVLLLDRFIEIYAKTVYVVTVPTPIGKDHIPDLTFLEDASHEIGKFLKKDDIVIYESTVYPGVTRDTCRPILEKVSNLKADRDFGIGYSPERINPGDKLNTLQKINKLVSAGDQNTLSIITSLYKTIIEAEVFSVSSIEVAEAAKVFENTQRDVNIALVNELSKLLNLASIDTEEVIKAASTKWNFVQVMPGLVGGHCISVDPYYLIQKAKELGMSPEIMTAARNTSDSMPKHIVDSIAKLILKKGGGIHKKVLALGYTFKENCPDIRNTKVHEIFTSFIELDFTITLYDPYVSSGSLNYSSGVRVVDNISEAIDTYDAILLLVAHDEFKEMLPEEIKALSQDPCIFADIKSVFEKSDSDFRL